MRFQHILRRLGRSPLFTIVTVVTLALGIGANTAIFSVIDGILLKPLPYPEPDRLVSLDHAALGVNMPNAESAPFLYYTYREQSRTLQDAGMWNGGRNSVTGLAEPQEVEAVDITGGVLPMLGARPAAGRLFTNQDDSPGAPRTVILGYGFWQSKFGGSPSAIGRTLTVNGRPREIIGVLPAGFRFLDRKPDLYLPMQLDRSKTHLGGFGSASIGRLKPGVTIEQLHADMARLIPVALQSFPPFPGFSLKLFEQARLEPRPKPLKNDLTGDIGDVLWVLMGTIGVVLLIACANVANLLLVRTEGRRQELAVRVALGASWTQLARALMVESVVLGIAGGVVGLGLAFGAVRLLVWMAPANLPRLDEIAIDGSAMLFTFGVSIAAGILFGAIPVAKYAKPHLAPSLRAGSRGMSQGRERHLVRSSLVVVQVGLALLLLIGSGLMIRTFFTLRNVHPGFTEPEQIQTLRYYFPEALIKEKTQVLEAHRQILDRIAAIPGVDAVAFTTRLPMDEGGWRDPIFVEGRPESESKIPPLRRLKMVSPGTATALGQPIVAGRDFTWADAIETRNVAMVSENLARELWGDPQAALGKRFRENPKGELREIVGVVGDLRDDGPNQRAPTTVLWPAMMKNFQGDDLRVSRGVALLIRSKRAGSTAFIAEVSQAIWSVNSNLPVAGVRTLGEMARRSMARTSFTLVMLAIAGGMALLLGVIGIYGVISYSVSQRTREIGIRMALGSSRAGVTRLFVGHGLRLAAIGVAVGLAAAVAGTRLLTSLLFEVSPLDPITFGGVSLILILAAIAASYVPALRAALVEPVEALRTD